MTFTGISSVDKVAFNTTTQTVYTCNGNASYNDASSQKHGKKIYSTNEVMRAVIRVVVLNAT
jgi:hypothetical protein